MKNGGNGTKVAASKFQLANPKKKGQRPFAPTKREKLERAYSEKKLKTSQDLTKLCEQN